MICPKKIRGFTLIELLVVITIILILSVLGFGGYARARTQARDTTRRADLQKMRSDLEIYRTDCGRYPRGESSPAFGGSLVGGETPCSGNTYISPVPQDPKPAVYSYRYYTADSGVTYSLCTYLENGSPNPLVCGGQSCGTVTCNYSVVNP